MDAAVGARDIKMIVGIQRWAPSGARDMRRYEGLCLPQGMRSLGEDAA